jgi:hypothetical protein
VDLLNEAGIPAMVLHQRPGFRCSWFDNSTAVTDIRATAVGPHDTVVVPEVDVDVVAALPRRVRHIVLNQSGHLTWRRAGAVVAGHYRAGAGVGLLGTVVVSQHSARLLAFAYPDLTVVRVRNGIDPALFHPGTEPRPRLLTHFPRRGPQDGDLVLRLLEVSGALRGWQVQPLHGLSQSVFAAALRRSRITLNLSYQEGFGLPALEAMASGSYVVGYHGFGGSEFLLPPFSLPVPTGDVLAVAQGVAEAIRRDEDDEDWCRSRGRQAAAFVQDNYSLDHEHDSVITAYSALLAAGGPEGTGEGER